MNDQSKGRWMLLVLVGVFVLPVVIGLCLFFFGKGEGGTGHGVLIKPPRLLEKSSVVDWQGRWHMVYVNNEGCDASCAERLNQMRQIHVSLAKDIDRMQRVWISAKPLDEAVLRPIRESYPDLLIVNASPAMAGQFNSGGNGASEVGALFMVDPRGNLMMSYPPEVDAKDIRKDIVRLLTYSWTG